MTVLPLRSTTLTLCPERDVVADCREAAIANQQLRDDPVVPSIV